MVSQDSCEDPRPPTHEEVKLFLLKERFSETMNHDKPRYFCKGCCGRGKVRSFATAAEEHRRRDAINKQRLHNGTKPYPFV